MDTKEHMTFSGERAQYFLGDALFRDCEFSDGESCLKHGTNLDIQDSKFKYKYPLWNTKDVCVDSSHFYELGKSGLWYVENFELKNSVVDAPKEFRRSRGIKIENVQFNNAAETLWSCTDVQLKNVTAKGDYFAMNCTGFEAEKFNLEGNYFLDGGKNIVIKNCRLNSKDAFWNCENVTVYDSYINGEYLGWYSKNLKFVNCIIESNQGLCYIENLTLENCTFVNTGLAFEYCVNVNAEVINRIESVKNPVSGTIKAKEIGTLILNPKRCDKNLIQIECDKIEHTFYEDPNPNEN